MNEIELDELKAAMRAATPAPDGTKKAANLALAREKFDLIQGSADVLRQIPDSPEMGILRRIMMMLHLFSNRAALTAATAIVAAGVLVFLPISDALDPSPVSVGREALVREQMVERLAQADETMDMSSAPVELRQRVQSPLNQFWESEFLLETEDGILLEHQIIEPAWTSQEGNTDVREQMVERRARAGAAMDMSSAQVELHQRVHSPLNQHWEGENLLETEDGILLESRIIEPAWPSEKGNTEEFASAEDSPVKVASEIPVSTFSIDVDTASYSVVRSSLMNGILPPAEAVRVEEMINYFPYAHPAPDGDLPFRPTVSVFPTPWNPDTKLLQIAIQGALPEVENRPPLNLVFLIDTSGSMDQANKLPLLKQSFRLLLGQLQPEDEVAIVTYAGSAGQVLEPTSALNRDAIRTVLDGLSAGGSTAGQAGLQQAYSTARGMTDDGEVTRVILATDGDFNVGLADPEELKKFIKSQAESGTYLSVLGFGRGNLDDATMQALAQHGNGTAAYIDTLGEAQKVLVDQLSGALFPIADDVKIQVEFNPSQIAEYRLIGYETRALRREDFNNDAVDAGEIGAGHSVTAIYEITPVGSPARLSDPLRYRAEEVSDTSDEFGYLRLRYKAPGAAASQLIEQPISSDSVPSSEVGFAAAVAGFGQLLRGSSYLGNWSWDDAIELANANRGLDPYGYRAEAVQLMRLAQSLDQQY